ncbi:putative bifunctional diguanylate cyclase/phosphodiesterase [Paenibacillus sp. TAB 01]|uniref:putative bifunctional diguanylate cyclase/phosphodiesterase n=1 Tax=Paenibacillus sp. TAB 01 TaxID=3368988 RepID=UPI0037501E10
MVALKMLVQFSNHAALMTVFVLLVNGLTVKWSGRSWWYRRLCAGGLYAVSLAMGLSGWLLWVRPVAFGWVIAAMLLATALGWIIGKGWTDSAKRALAYRLRMLDQAEAEAAAYRQTAAAASESAFCPDSHEARPSKAEALLQVQAAVQEGAASEREQASAQAQALVQDRVPTQAQDRVQAQDQAQPKVQIQTQAQDQMQDQAHLKVQTQAQYQAQVGALIQAQTQAQAKEALSVQHQQALLLAQEAMPLSAADAYPMRLRQELAGALQREEFQLLYQPQFETGTERIRGFEALLRWHHPELGSIPPDKFIPIAEETGWIVPIGEWVLREACRFNRLLQETEGITAVMCVNISAVQLQEASFADSVCLVLQETGLSPEALELEITESMLILSWAAAADNLCRLQEYGVRIALDDFGTGYSSLSYLQRLPVHLVKIDRSFIHGIPHSAREKALVESVIHLVHQLGIGVLAEGIEKEEQLCCLRDISCDCVQGFLLGRPMDDRALSSYVQAYRERQEPVLIS